MIELIIVFGGAFNQVTNAHLKVCDFLREQYPHATFLFLPVSSLYTKGELASDYDRINMLELAIGGKENIAISHLEINDSDFKGTYQSLIRIADRFADEVAFVIGADNLINMHKWINIHGILSEFKILVLGRYGLDVNTLIDNNLVLKRHINNFVLFEEFNMDISSTGFRETMDISQVPQQVFDYITDNELYGGEEDV